MSLLNEEERNEIERDQTGEMETAARFKEEQEKRGAVVDQLNITNILELSQRDHEVLTQIKKFMTQQENELQQEISVMQRLMIEQATQKLSDSEQSEEDEDDLVTQQDLKDYSKKLQVSIQVIKIVLSGNNQAIRASYCYDRLTNTYFPIGRSIEK